MTWKQLEGERAIDPDFYVEEGPKAVYKSCALAERTYGWRGRMWPRIQVCVYKGYDSGKAKCMSEEPTFKLSAAYKSQQGQWWQTLDGIPLSLLSVATELIAEVERKQNGESR